MTSARLLRVVPAIVVVLAVVPLGGAAQASFPGTNGPIAYATNSTTNFCPDVYKINADGTEKMKLTACPETAADPSWNAGGSTLALAANNGNPTPRIATLPASGGSLSFVTTTGVSPARDPSFSGDGSAIVFGGGSGGGPDSKDIYTVPAAGGTPTNLTNAGDFEINKEPEFSPDGTKIAWARKTGPEFDVWVMNADGTNPVNLTAGETGNQDWPSWSPDGTKIAFASSRFGDYEIFTINADGTNVQQITDETGKDDIQPAFSPDGTLIAFTQGCKSDDCSNGPDPHDNGGIYTTDLNGAETPVINTADPEYDPSWGVACTTNCGPPPPTHVTRTLSLAFKGSLKATGVLNDTTGQNPQCEGGQKVKIQKKDGGSWESVKTATTTSTGSYSVSIPNSSGTYRALAPLVDRSQTVNLICDQAISKTRSYTATHPRVFLLFGVNDAGSSMGSVAIIKATDGFAACVSHMPIKIQRQSGTSWVTIKTQKTGSPNGQGEAGYVIAGLPNRDGTYRGFAPLVKLQSGDVCAAATSKTTRFPPA